MIMYLLLYGKPPACMDQTTHLHSLNITLCILWNVVVIVYNAWKQIVSCLIPLCWNTVVDICQTINSRISSTMVTRDPVPQHTIWPSGESQMLQITDLLASRRTLKPAEVHFGAAGLWVFAERSDNWNEVVHLMLYKWHVVKHISCKAV